MTVRLAHWAVRAAVCIAALSGCGGGGAAGSVTGNLGSFTHATVVPNQPLGTTAIQHVVIIIQENRSFDNLFAGFPGADTATSGLMHDGTRVTLQPVKLSEQYDIDHGYGSFRTSWDGGRMDGFNAEPVYGYLNGKYQSLSGMGKFPYGYVQRSDIAPYWQLASTYTLADRMFQSNGGPSFPAHQYLIAGQADNVINSPPVAPWGCDSAAGTTLVVLTSTGAEVPGPFPCFTYASLADELDRRNVSWRYYSPPLTSVSGIYSAYDAIKQIRYSPDWSADVISPETKILKDVSAGQLAAVTWVVPSFADSDHPGVVPDYGPQWVSSVVDAVGRSKFWPNTAIFILWDDWGGWYDHVPPTQYDAMGLGFRVPLLVVSPYAQSGYVSHTQHEFGSILKFVEDDFGLPSLGEVDARSDNLTDCFDFSQRPRPFAALRTTPGAAYFLRQRQSLPPDNE
jgi:phospholipase C